MITDPSDAFSVQALARFPAHVRDDAALAARLRRVARVSEFALDTLVQQPEVLAALAADDGATPQPAPELLPDARAGWARQLRRWRQAESTRLIWRDALGLDDIGETLTASTRLAEQCLGLALAALEAEFIRRYGQVRDADGQPVRLTVFALGKLGGEALNFSSDIDLVYTFAAEGVSDGPRVLAAGEYFVRLGQQLTRLLDETTADGLCYRVDLRLRPFGGASPLAQSVAAMETYFQREGRDWERYAWLKARPVAGDLAAGERFLETLRPFIYRRYLDYGALDGLRAMKAAIAAEVARRELTDDLKRGPGGIREIEFLVQVLQLIRGGREAALRERRLLSALEALAAAGHVTAETAAALRAAYRFLRQLENRVQMWHDAQTHRLPDAPDARRRLAQSLGFADWPALAAELDAHRARVTREFEALLAPHQPLPTVPDAAASYWRALPAQGESSVLATLGFKDVDAVDTVLRDFARTSGVQGLSDAARARLDRVLPALLHATAATAHPLLTVRRVLALLGNLLRRTSYLALLDEQPAALARLVDVLSRSALLAERLAAHPLLLDELLDARIGGALPAPADLLAACRQCLSANDDETALFALNELRQQASFRIALATLDARLAPEHATAHLARLADGIIAAVLELAQRQLQATHGQVPGVRFLVVGYGSLGGEELGFSSDLDLVFLFDAPAAAQSDAERTLDAGRWCARLAQKVIALLGTVTGAGRLYDIDVRLRPDGGKAVLVSSLSAYADYQQTRAWTWEHQALVRARAVAGDGVLADEFETIRNLVLRRAREVRVLAGDVAEMRLKMRRALDRSEDGWFDLKQGEGGLSDLEFILQYLVLREARQHPAVTVPRASRDLIAALQDVQALDARTAEALLHAQSWLLARSLECTLDRRARRVAHSDAALDNARAAVRGAWQRLGLAAAG